MLFQDLSSSHSKQKQTISDQMARKEIDNVHKVGPRPCCICCAFKLGNMLVMKDGRAEAQEEVQRLHQQQFQLLAELYMTITNHRKESSVPGSVANEAALFKKDDIANAANVQKINMAKKSYMGSQFPRVFDTKIITSLPLTGGKFGKTRSFGGFEYQNTPYNFDSLEPRAAKVCHKPSMAMAAHLFPLRWKRIWPWWPWMEFHFPIEVL